MRNQSQLVKTHIESTVKKYAIVCFIYYLRNDTVS